jgi:hypothetical protein
MTKVRIFPLLIIVLSIFLILIPWLLFPVCGVGRFAIAMPGGMKEMHECGATLNFVTIFGIIGIVIGVVVQVRPGRVIAIAASIAIAVLGGLVILFPTAITGVCRVANMPCVYGTKPALIVAGFVMVLFGIAGFYLFGKTL